MKEEVMSRATTNLTRPYAVRLRHDQRQKLARIINRLSADEIDELVHKDRLKFNEPKAFKNRGRATNPEIILIRAALDEYLSRYDDQLSLFDEGDL